MIISLHVDVRDPPFALPPPQAEFGETIKYEESLQLTSSEASPAFESEEASLIYSFPKHKSIKVSMTPRLSTPIENIATVDVSQEKSFEPSAEQDKTGWPRSTTPGIKLKVLKNRRSLQSLFISPFLHNQSSVAHPATAPPSYLSRARSQSAPRQPGSSTVASLKSKPSTSTLVPRSVSPSTFLIDEDPFANICTPPSVTGPHRPPGPTPRSPPSTTASTDLGPDKPADTPPLPPLSAPSTPPVVTHRPKSSSHAQARGAYTKPAFISRPSLPSLHTLAQMNVMVPKKTRRGTVGARLPYEPWNMDLDDLTQIRQTTSPNSSSIGHKPKVPSIADFTLGLGGDVSESVSTFDIDEDSEPYGPPLQEFTDGESPPSLSYTPSDPSLYSLSRSSSLASVSSSGLQSVDEMNSSSSSFDLDLDEPLNDYDFERYNDQDPLQSEPDFDYYWQSSPGGPKSRSRSRSRSRSPSTWPDVGRTPHSSIYYTNASLYTPDDRAFRPGTSAETIRSSLYNAMGSARPDSSLLPENNTYEQDMVDGNGWDGRHSNGYRGNGDDRDYRRRNSGEREGGRGGGRRDGDSNDNNYGAGGGGRGGGDQDGDDRRDRRSEVTSSFSTPSDSEDDQEEDTETTTDDYGTDSASPSALSPTARHPVNPIPGSSSGASTGTDDDVPLAQQIPTALNAQKTIRKQVRNERDQRRKERAGGGSSSTAREPISPRRTAMEQPLMISSSQESALRPSRSAGRQRTKTVPSNSGRPLAVDDLTKKLLNVQAAGSPPAALLQPRVPRGRDHGDNNDELGRRLLSFQAVGSPAAVTSALRPSSSQGRDQQRNSANDQPMSTQQSRPGADGSSRDQGLRPMRSLRGLASKLPEGYSTGTVEAGSGQRLGRSVTSVRARRPDDIYLNSKSASVPLTTLNRLSADRPRAHRISEEVAHPNIGGHTSTSADNTSNSSPQRSSSRPPVPPMPPAEVLSNLAQSSSSKIQSTPQRIFIENKQRFNMVEITPSTNAGEVVQMVERQAALEKLGAGSGSWMLWEVAQDFNMERPIREYELLSDVESSWNKEKLVNIFVIKKTPLAPLLIRAAIPPSSPKNRGYVQWESKKGKWNKRWMELREHSLWLSKRDTGKDEVLLCSLSNFDVYHVSQLHKAPKPYVFAVKSADNLSLFENASDYVHFFSCGQKEGETWMQAILLARSYVLYQERNILFAPKPSTGGTTSATAKPLSRSGTRKQAPAAQRSLHPIQPLVNISAPFAAASSPSSAVFEPGSLLAKRRDF